ncbi:MAG: PIN domain-containing protein [Nitrososphaerales archaeon]
MEVNRFWYNKRMKRVLLDTSFLINLTYPSTGLDQIYQSLGKVEFLVSKGVIKELKRLASSKTEKAKRAKLALNFVKVFKVLSLEEDLKADEEILKLAEREKLMVCTNDIKLMRELKERGIEIISLKHRKLIF